MKRIVRYLIAIVFCVCGLPFYCLATVGSTLEALYTWMYKEPPYHSYDHPMEVLVFPMVSYADTVVFLATGHWPFRPGY